jgi:hypothetical protein
LIEQRIEARGETLYPVFLDELQQCLLARRTRRELGPNVTQNLARDTHVALDEREDGVNRSSLLVQPQRRNAQALSKYFGRIAPIAAWCHTADIELMAHCRRPTDKAVAAIYRLHNVKVG